jgi:ribosomal protein S27AE
VRLAGLDDEDFAGLRLGRLTGEIDGGGERCRRKGMPIAFPAHTLRLYCGNCGRSRQDEFDDDAVGAART